MDPISIGLMLASRFAPALIRHFAGDAAGDVATKVVGIAKDVTGQSDDARALEALKANPELATAFQKQANDLALGMAEADVKKLESINQTMRVEQQAGGWKSGWRPLFGYVTAVSFGLMVVAVFAAVGASIALVFMDQGDRVGTLTAGLSTLFGAMASLWSIALAVLGVSVYQRSKDKAVAASGQQPAGVLQAIAKRIGG